jgi:uncharacterized repeat protein (TIGR01451 family)
MMDLCDLTRSQIKGPVVTASAGVKLEHVDGDQAARLAWSVEEDDMNLGIRAVALTAVALAAAMFAMAPDSASAQQEPDPCAPLLPAGVSAQQTEEPLCEITVEKTLASVNPAQVGTTVTFNIVVTNSGMAPLANVILIDEYDPALLDYVGASLTETDVDESVGIIAWEGLLPDPDGGNSSVWDAGESRTLSVSFRALQKPTAENCAIAIADVAFFIELLQEGPPEIGVESEFSCASVRIVDGGGGGGGSRRPTSTPTDTPDTATPVSTVAPATVVPATPRPVGIAAPDTGTGGGPGGGSGSMLIITVVIAAVTGIVGSAMIRKAIH